jgi:hypothetical protein
MIGSPGIAAFIAQAVFVGLMIWGWLSGELGWKSLTVFALLFIVGFVGRSCLRGGAPFFPPVVAIMDIVLVLLIFKGDVRIS